LNRLSRFYRVVAWDALEQQPFHLRQRGAPGEIVWILLPLMGVTVNVDGVFDFDMRRVNGRFVLRARRVGRDATFVGRVDTIFSGMVLSPLAGGWECCYRHGDCQSFK
jgi:hypothetical protein